MRLSDLLITQVSPGSRARGYAYFVQGAVRALQRSDSGFQAVVHGSQIYSVSVEVEDGRLTASCTCPYAQDRAEACKHIWATLLEAERQQVTLPLDSAGNRPRLSIELARGVSADGVFAGGVTAAPASPLVPATPPVAAAAAKPRPRGKWQQVLETIATTPLSPAAEEAEWVQGGTQLVYVVDVDQSRAAESVVIELFRRDRRANGEWGKPKPARMTRDQIDTLAEDERALFNRVMGAQVHQPWDGTYLAHRQIERLRLNPALCAEQLAAIAGAGRAMLRAPLPKGSPGAARRWGSRQRRPGKRVVNDLLPLAWDDGPPWTFEVTIDDANSELLVYGALVREGETMPLADPLLLLADGILLTRTHAARLICDGGFVWAAALRTHGPIKVPASGRRDLEDALAIHPPRVQAVPDNLRLNVEAIRPLPRLRLVKSSGPSDRLRGEVSFDYGGVGVPAGTPHPIVRLPETDQIVRRDLAGEQALLRDLRNAGFRDEWSFEASVERPHIAAPLLQRAIRTLAAGGWQIESAGVRYRQPASFSMQVTSGIDWFDLASYADYGGERVSLPQLLAARARGEQMVPLADGSMGIVPDEWLRAHALLPTLAATEGDVLRFKTSQVALLDALLATQPATSWDDRFAEARQRLLAFDGIRPADPPASFAGTLRAYQRDGLGWLLFLRQFGFGGCLADDMGLGKTVMVLALLARVRDEAKAAPASLVVAPRSLVFNWRQEAERFAPGLRVLDYTGSDRAALRDRFADYDVVLTTYGTLRVDAAHLSAMHFEYVVLDESQAVKNAASASAKAVRLLHANHRLALSGTPVENHLGELWSLFEFLNPGLLGTSRAFADLGSPRNTDEESTALLARALRPFILRRTKEQVAPELPERTEQTLFCELEPAQRALYDELREHYRRALLDRVSGAAFGRSKLQMLEALLRLRQAASHPGLVDASRTGEPSAKLDVLLPHLAEAVEEGHKTLVFSQFTSFLAIVRQRLDAEGIAYEYLDGRTRDRQEIVERFQNDPDRRLFLVSLKAGGVGLNLTAAEYVFLLDPWWNPAVEAQAIDRAHRIGQTRHVFAYRLIAKDTVEERVLELQQRKQHLADAILKADGGLVRDLNREDLELLLS